MDRKVADNIKTIISNKGLKHSWVAQQMDLSKDQLSFIFQGRKRITCELIMRFCEVLKVEPNDLFYESYAKRVRPLNKCIAGGADDGKIIHCESDANIL